MHKRFMLSVFACLCWDSRHVPPCLACVYIVVICCMPVFVGGFVHMCLRRPEEIGTSETGIIGGYEQPGKCWELEE